MPLGEERDQRELATLHPGERVIVTDEMELWAEGDAACIEAYGTRWWYVQNFTTWHYLDEEPLPTGTIVVADVA